MRDWLRRSTRWFVWGLLSWGVVSGVGAVWALVKSKSVLPAIVTANEWAAALLLLPWILGSAAGALSRGAAAQTALQGVLAGASTQATETHLRDAMSGRRWHGWLTYAGSRVGLVIFGMDLMIRWIFNLGWKPF